MCCSIFAQRYSHATSQHWKCDCREPFIDNTRVIFKKYFSGTSMMMLMMMMMMMMMTMMKMMIMTTTTKDKNQVVLCEDD